MFRHFTLIFTAALALSACSINNDLRAFRDTVPDRIAGLAWLSLEPLGAFAPLAPLEPAPNVQSMLARVAALRAAAATLRAHPVLDPRRARQMRAALAEVNR